ncbi:hypothetical protein [Chondromyces crocatus]|uniref:Uncharacterized protein n=1 Tax=Chondromyces crocatus TaxID=52 RepID=A0A0K1EJL8_CHOCO|nr:hypothetical protein [Chondromyces crocatus]AKT40788.1 uncharacterized protein CMC5_049440 [Chondromyces crocatus]
MSPTLPVALQVCIMVFAMIGGLHVGALSRRVQRVNAWKASPDGKIYREASASWLLAQGRIEHLAPVKYYVIPSSPRRPVHMATEDRPC